MWNVFILLSLETFVLKVKSKVLDLHKIDVTYTQRPQCTHHFGCSGRLTLPALARPVLSYLCGNTDVAIHNLKCP